MGRERSGRIAVAGSRRPGPGTDAPEDIDPRELAPEIRSQLRTLSKLTADRVARHLVAAGRLIDDDPEAALQHARAARAIGARVAVVREAVGETAYAAGEWAEAIAELRTARRMTGDDTALPLIADSERALGRPERALRIAQSGEVQALPADARVEMRIVEAGARRDLGQLDAALITLEGGGLDRKQVEPWSARLWYAYADMLLALDRADEARDWFAAAAAADELGTTDADERLLELDGVTVLEDEDDDDTLDPDAAGEEDGETAAEDAADRETAPEGAVDDVAGAAGHAVELNARENEDVAEDAELDASAGEGIADQSAVHDGGEAAPDASEDDRVSDETAVPDGEDAELDAAGSGAPPSEAAVPDGEDAELDAAGSGVPPSEAAVPDGENAELDAVGTEASSSEAAVSDGEDAELDAVGTEASSSEAAVPDGEDAELDIPGDDGGAVEGAVPDGEARGSGVSAVEFSAAGGQDGESGSSA